jgi:hypothetical protein
MQKGQKIEDKHAGSWDQVYWVLRWKRITPSLLLFFTSLLLLCFFSLFFKILLLFYSLKSRSSDLQCPMFPLIPSVTPKVSVLRLTDTKQQPQQQPTASSVLQAASSQPINQSPVSSLASLLYTENKEVEQQFLGRGVTL